MNQIISKLIIYGDLPKDSILMELADICEQVKSDRYNKDELITRIYKQIKHILIIATDYGFDENGDIQVMSDRNRRAVKIVKIKDDGIYIEKALKSKNLRIPWGKISLVSPTKEIKDGLKIDMYDGKYVVFSIYNSYKIQQITQYIFNYINDKRTNNEAMYS